MTAPVLRTAPACAPTLLAAALLAGCQPKPAAPPPPAASADMPGLTLVEYPQLPGWRSDPVGDALPALKLQCRRLALLPADTALGGTGPAELYGGRAGQWTRACQAANLLSPTADAHRFFEAWFAPFRVNAPALVTGYFEPVIPGARSRSAQYQVPVLARPEDLVRTGGLDESGRPALGRMDGGTVVPYWTRAEIEDGKMGAEARPILYLQSPVDLFFAQLQGSARVQLAEGGTARLVFAARNGRPYTAIGHVLAERHALAAGDISMQSIRQWLEAHPDEARSVMDRNESYVFFREAQDDPTLGPPGALGVDLAPGRSAAVDKRFIPLASPVFVDSTIPDGRVWQHMVLAQDLGSAIAGPARVDVFFGDGAVAADWAGRMHQHGAIFILLPRPPPA